jgi:hypothetical protein
MLMETRERERERRKIRTWRKKEGASERRYKQAGGGSDRLRRECRIKAAGRVLSKATLYFFFFFLPIFKIGLNAILPTLF